MRSSKTRVELFDTANGLFTPRRQHDLRVLLRGCLRIRQKIRRFWPLLRVLSKALSPRISSICTPSAQYLHYRSPGDYQLFFSLGEKRLILCLLLMPALGGCLNNGGTKPFSSTKAKGGIAASAPLISGQDGTQPLLKLVYVVRNSIDPSGTLDLIGDDSQTMGQFCAANATTAQANAGASSCSCVYDYIKADGAHESFEAPSVYNEASLLRCKYTQVPAGLAYMDVKIHLTNSDTFSNAVKFYFQAGANAALDLSSPVSFVQALRYQCKDLVTIRYMFDGAHMYDPFQSADPALSYPLNFYTNNLGGAMVNYVGAKVQSWFCPALPNDPKENMDLRIFSNYADKNGSKLIYPPEGSEFDRSTFYLAKKPSGAFNVAINSYVAPQLASADPAFGGSAPLPLGYGAKAVASGFGREVCPVDTVIPPGFKWVKLWLFRADLPRRSYRTSGKVSEMHSVACQPDLWTWSDGAVVVSKCKDQNQSSSELVRIYGGVDGNNTCTQITNGTFGKVNQSGSTFTNAANAIYFNEANSTDLPLQSDGWAIEGGKDSIDPQPGLADLDGLNPRFDFLFVVSPPEVMASDMTKSESSVRNTYVPYRFPLPSDCLSKDPDEAGGLDCAASKIIKYEIKLHDVAGNGDPAGDDPSRQGVFPVCALQPL